MFLGLGEASRDSSPHKPEKQELQTKRAGWVGALGGAGKGLPGNNRRQRCEREKGDLRARLKLGCLDGEVMRPQREGEEAGRED